MQHKRIDPVRHFWASIHKTDTCWLWTANTTYAGYGRLHVGGAKIVRAHRFAYELLVGPIPEGLVLDHLCRVRLCVNPAHLEPVTDRENILRGVSFSAANAAKTHCKHGHEFTPENTLMSKTKTGYSRVCLACKRAASRERRARRRSRV